MQSAQTIDIDDSQTPQAKPRLLVVDDVADNRAILIRRLVRRGFDVVEAIGGQDALDKIGAEAFDLVLLDIMMPDINGNEVLRRIRERFSEIELPVIMVTAKGLSDDVVESINLGANDYVTKPVDFAVALARIQSNLQRKLMADRLNRDKQTAESQAAELKVVVLKNETQLLDESCRRQQSEEQLRFLAFHDPLTGLLNRQGFNTALSEALEATKRGETETALLFVISISSNRSTTLTAMTWAISCLPPSAPVCARRSAKGWRWPASAVTNSPSSRPRPISRT